MNPHIENQVCCAGCPEMLQEGESGQRCQEDCPCESVPGFGSMETLDKTSIDKAGDVSGLVQGRPGREP